MVKTEVGQLRARGAELESQVKDLRLVCNAKIAAAEVGDIIDRKL